MYRGTAFRLIVGYAICLGVLMMVVWSSGSESVAGRAESPARTTTPVAPSPGPVTQSPTPSATAEATPSPTPTASPDPTTPSPLSSESDESADPEHRETASDGDRGGAGDGRESVGDDGHGSEGDRTDSDPEAPSPTSAPSPDEDQSPTDDPSETSSMPRRDPLPEPISFASISLDEVCNREDRFTVSWSNSTSVEGYHVSVFGPSLSRTQRGPETSMTVACPRAAGTVQLQGYAYRGVAESDWTYTTLEYSAPMDQQEDPTPTKTTTPDRAGHTNISNIQVPTGHDVGRESTTQR